MKTLFKKILCGAPFAIASIVSLNACSGENGVDGVNGKDGVDGKDGVSVTDTLYVFQKDTVLIKDTVIFAGDTIYISKKDTVVIDNRDTVYIENGGSGSGNGGAGTGGNTSFDTLVDERDGQTYRTTKIGDQVWMAENLNFLVEGSMCYDNNLVNCETYGRLYTWYAAQDVCPSGWHLPSKEEFKTLLENVGENGFERFKNLTVRSWTLRTDPYGFSALPAGYYDSYRYKFYSLGGGAYFWSSNDGRCQPTIEDDNASVDCDDVRLSDKGDGYSVRCLQD